VGCGGKIPSAPPPGVGCCRMVTVGQACFAEAWSMKAAKRCLRPRLRLALSRGMAIPFSPPPRSSGALQEERKGSGASGPEPQPLRAFT